VTAYPRKSHHARDVTLKSLGLGIGVFFLGSMSAAWLTLNNVHGFLAFMDNFLAGIAAGLIVLLYERWREREVDKKLRTIRLQTILASPCGVDGSEERTRCHDAVRRIEWALREVLPGEFELTDTSAPPNPGTAKKVSDT
jgi:hypothetical protein